MMHKRKSNIVLYVAVILLLLVCLSTRILFSGLNARYIVRDNASDEARVATFSVSASSVADDGDINFTEGENYTQYAITINNKSEVDVTSTVEVTVDLPAGFSVLVDGKTHTNKIGNKYIFEDVAYVDSNNTLVCYLQFSGDISAITQGSLGNTINGSFDFNTNVTFTQAD